jgi:hypothetical protein
MSHRGVLSRGALTVTDAAEERQNAIGAGGYRSGQTGQTVNLMAYAFAGSNPAPPSGNDK